MFENIKEFSTYTKALDGVKDELRRKRSELADLAKKTVDHFNVAIPGLRKKAEELNAEIKKLQDGIVEKQKQYASEKSSYLAEYEELKKNLQAAYEGKGRELTALKAEAEKTKQEFSAWAKEFESKVKDLDSSTEAAKAEVVKNQKAGDSLKSEREKLLGELSLQKSKLSEKDAQNQALGEQLKSEIKKCQDKTKLLEGKIVEAEAIISRINEANKILAKAKDMEDAAKRQQEKNNTDAVNNLADRKKINAKAEEQRKFDEALKVRENNVKLVEQKIAQ